MHQRLILQGKRAPTRAWLTYDQRVFSQSSWCPAAARRGNGAMELLRRAQSSWARSMQLWNSGAATAFFPYPYSTSLSRVHCIS
eukprot:1149343-Pelagomonas_calceolata.AAC.5